MKEVSLQKKLYTLPVVAGYVFFCYANYLHTHMNHHGYDFIVWMCNPLVKFYEAMKPQNVPRAHIAPRTADLIPSSIFFICRQRFLEILITKTFTNNTTYGIHCLHKALRKKRIAAYATYQNWVIVFFFH